MGHLDLDKTKFPTEVWGSDHRENETGCGDSEDCRFPSKHVRMLFTSLNRHHLVCQGRGFKSCSLVVWNVIGVRRANCSSIRVFEAVVMFVCQKVVMSS
jgi:hypothetical protein